MKTLSEVPDYSDLKREVEALRKRIDELESGRARPKGAARARRWRLTRRRAWALPAVIVAVLLALGVLGAQNDPLFIDPNGNVSIGIARFSKIAVNQAPQDGQKVIITADGTDVPFNVTDKSNTVNWLTVFKDGNVAMNGGNVGIGKSLDVAGDLNLGNSVVYFTNTDHRAAATALQGGVAAIENSKDRGALEIFGRDTPTRRRVVAISDRLGIGTSFPNETLEVGGNAVVSGGLTVKGGIRGQLWTSQDYEWNQGQGPTQMTRADHSACFLTYVSGYFNGKGESVEIKRNDPYWVLTGTSEQMVAAPAGTMAEVRAKARCIGAADDAW